MIHWPHPSLEWGTRLSDSLRECVFDKKFPETRITGGQQDYRFESVNLCLDCFRSRSQSSTSEYEKKLNWYDNRTDGRAYVCTSFRHPFLICLTFNPSCAHGALPVAYENNRSNFSCLVTGESPNCCTICSVTAIGPRPARWARWLAVDSRDWPIFLYTLYKIRPGPRVWTLRSGGGFLISGRGPLSGPPNNTIARDDME